MPVSSELGVRLEIQTIIRLLAAAIALLFVLHLLGLAWLTHNDFVLDRWSWLFNLGYENNVPTMFSFFLLASCGLALLLIGYAERIERDRFRHHWTGLGVVFLLLALDEALAFHEVVGEIVQASLNTSGVFYYAWTIPYAGFVLALAVLYATFLYALPAVTRRWFLCAAAIYLSGAVALEMFESALYQSCPAPCWPDLGLTMIEETLEMVGLVVFMRGLLGYMADPARRFNISFHTRGDSQAEPEHTGDGSPSAYRFP